ncbi:hypothetical protein BDN72DRAFT_862162 [Pluteus cervinus]|uniref:Uncharacterized protein n=1 Tax=Pluteus cervinus TaxID=181527 RepID=A0ACD3ABW6_9AGAR|nr:hypothetical protein BDN72DRAFT_862162 [Pluteus cervinus]
MNVGGNHSALHEDVLLCIFEFGIKDNSHLALRLTHISRHWRLLCLSSSILWSNISVVNDYQAWTSSHSVRSKKARNPDFQLLRYYLHHSSTMPLDVLVHIRIPPVTAISDESDTYNGALVFFESLSVRTASGPGLPRGWESLVDLQVEWTRPLKAFERIPWEVRTQQLVGLLQDDTNATPLGGTSIPGHPSPSSIPRTLRLLPKLKKLSIRSHVLDWDRFAPIDLEELHLCDLHDEAKPSHGQIRAILRASQATLEVLSLIDASKPFHVDDEDEDEPAGVNLPSLHAITLGYINPRDLYPLTNYIKVPALTNLTIQNVGGRRFEYSIDGFLRPQERVYFSSTNSLLSRIDSNWGLKNLESVTLQNLQFLFDNTQMPPNPVLDMEAVEALFGDEGDVRMEVDQDNERWQITKAFLPISFWHRCRKLKDLVLIRPDPATLYSLCCPAPSSMSYSPGDGSVLETLKEEDSMDGSWIHTMGRKLLRLPVPHLQSIGLLDISKEDAKSVIGGRKMGLAKYRAQVWSGPNILNTEMNTDDLVQYHTTFL